MQSNIGNRRERTWIILRATKRKCQRNRFNIWCVRWWELEPDQRMRLYQSAERNGGQNIFPLYRYRTLPKTFEKHMRRKIEKEPSDSVKI